MNKTRLATVWLDGCSGCHMSFLDLDERLAEIIGLVDIVYSPVVDSKDFPENVDVAIVEGAISSEEDLHKIMLIRERSKCLISLGDCATNSNVPSMRNPFGRESILNRAYIENADLNQQIPSQGVPKLLPQAVPVHQVVNVDVFVPGCPPSADTIYYVLTELLNGRVPDIAAHTRFGA